MESSPPVHISVPSTSGRARRPGIHLHRTPSLNPHPEPFPSPSYLQQEGGRRGRLLVTETLFLAFVHRYAIPLPEVNVKLGRWTVDFLWRRERLVVETDFWGYHRGSFSFEEDHARDLDLRSAGYTVSRYDDTQLESEPDRVAADVAAALAMSSVARG